MNRKQKGFMAAAFLLLGTAILACQPQQGAPPDDGLSMQRYGDEVLAIADEGSLSEQRPTTPDQRQETLAGYFRDHRKTFGATGVDADNIRFAAALPQVKATRSDGASFTMVALHQTAHGAQVTDKVLYGAFLEDGDGSHLLQRVRGQLYDPANLPKPPVLDAATLEKTRRMAELLARQRGLSADQWSLEEQAVISSRFGASGFLMRGSRPGKEGGSFFSALVDPRNERIMVLEDQPNCEAGTASQGGQ